ncbi:MAG: hypothetical protein DPW09_34820, partial [Anaerolineae bacterium]|nr:hypothetical protein [Anaerolineae bacterium]
MRHQSQKITYQVADQTAQGYLVMPEHGEGPGVLVLHAWWGLNDTIRAVCARLAEAGCRSVGPRPGGD